MVKFIFQLFTWLGEMIDREGTQMLMLEYVQSAFKVSKVLKHEVILCKKGHTKYELLIVTMPGDKRLRFMGFRHSKGHILNSFPLGVMPYDQVTHYRFDIKDSKLLLGVSPSTSLMERIIADQIILNN